MKSLSECYVVHFISETRILYHVSETKVNARIEKFLSCQSRADFGGIRVRPFERERPALLGLHGIDAAEVVVRQVDAGAVRSTLEDEALPVGRDLRLARDKLRFAHSKKRRDARDLRVQDAHYSVFDTAARPAHPALELSRLHFWFLPFDNFPVAVFVGANAADFAGRLKVLHLAGNPSRRYLKKIGKFHFRNEWICPHILLYLLRKRI